MTSCTIGAAHEGGRGVFTLTGVFDRTTAWELRDQLEREAAPELILDFSQVRDFSDLGVAILAHALSGKDRRVLFRGLRQHQLRILRYCGVSVEETSAREAKAVPTPVPSP
jgi:anti-anti-sigma regulatory factor